VAAAVGALEVAELDDDDRGVAAALEYVTCEGEAGPVRVGEEACRGSPKWKLSFALLPVLLRRLCSALRRTTERDRFDPVGEGFVWLCAAEAEFFA